MNYNNPAAHDVAVQATSTLNDKKRRALFAKLQRIGQHDAPNVPIVFILARTGIKDTVHNFHTLITGWWRLEQVYLG
jgi:ABC-type transport system substrate-binding protein